MILYLLLLRSRYFISASLLIVIHDFLDHVDGIVAKVHRSHYGAVDSPLLGSFLDAFCDKVSIIICTQFSSLAHIWSVLC